jgi:hypothetical protein
MRSCSGRLNSQFKTLAETTGIGARKTQMAMKED